MRIGFVVGGAGAPMGLAPRRLVEGSRKVLGLNPVERDAPGTCLSSNNSATLAQWPLKRLCCEKP